MGFLTPFTSRRLKAAWRYAPDGLLWRIVPCNGRRILGEVRTADRKSAWFFCLEEQAGRVLWEKRDFGLGWWCGLEGVSGDTAFLHRFPAPDLPVHAAVHAVDIPSGSLLWSAETLRFLTVHDGAVYAEEQMPLASRILELDARTGARKRMLEDGDRLPRPTIAGGTEGEGPRFPVPRSVMERDDPAAAALACGLIGEEGATSGVELLSHGAAVIASTGSALIVVDRGTRRVFYRDIITASSSAPVPEPFFMRDDMLVYVRERTVLTGVDLAPLQRPGKEGNVS